MKKDSAPFYWHRVFLYESTLVIAESSDQNNNENDPQKTAITESKTKSHRYPSPFLPI
jgi:hypothetical protein